VHLKQEYAIKRHVMRNLIECEEFEQYTCTWYS
jgi:hypothetical protein